MYLYSWFDALLLLVADVYSPHFSIQGFFFLLHGNVCHSFPFFSFVIIETHDYIVGVLLFLSQNVYHISNEHSFLRVSLMAMTRVICMIWTNAQLKSECVRFLSLFHSFSIFGCLFFASLHWPSLNFSDYLLSFSRESTLHHSLINKKREGKPMEKSTNLKLYSKYVVRTFVNGLRALFPVSLPKTITYTPLNEQVYNRLLS